jgi:hypothetical protein
MMKKQTRSVLKLLALAAVASGVLAGAASAESVTGKFTLPYDVRWGQALLPAGHYVIRIGGNGRPALVSTQAGKNVTFVMAQVVNAAATDQPTALLLTRGERERIVRSFNWREGNKSFVYKPYTSAERKLLAQSRQVESVPILMAQK